MAGTEKTGPGAGTEKMGPPTGGEKFGAGAGGEKIGSGSEEALPNDGALLFTRRSSSSSHVPQLVHSRDPSLIGCPHVGHSINALPLLRSHSRDDVRLKHLNSSTLARYSLIVRYFASILKNRAHHVSGVSVLSVHTPVSRKPHALAKEVRLACRAGCALILNEIANSPVFF